MRFCAALSGKDTTSGVLSRFRAVLAAVRNSGFGELPRVVSGLQTGYQMSRGKTKKFAVKKVYANADLARCKACVKLLLGITLP